MAKSPAAEAGDWVSRKEPLVCVDNFINNNSKNQILDQALVEVFASIFHGRTDAHGAIHGECIYETVTLEHFTRHLKGEQSLGIYLLLDDSTCYFSAIDLDEKDFNKARAIRQELFNNSIPAYIAESKSKGFHIYGFALERFKAREIRRVLHHILDKLNIKAEVFPKQDYHQPDDADGGKHPGSYVNLPCFGHTRPFLTGDMKEVSLEVALDRIKFIPQECIDRLLRTLPEEETDKKLGHTPEEIAGMLRQSLIVGERRPYLVKLVGYLRYRGIPEEVTVALLLPWAERAFNEPLPTDEVERHIRGIYQRYGIAERKTARLSKPWHAEVAL